MTHYQKREREQQHYVNKGAVPGVEIGQDSTDMTLNVSEPNTWTKTPDNLIYKLFKGRKI
jgi:hypothetical protein